MGEEEEARELITELNDVEKDVKTDWKATLQEVGKSIKEMSGITWFQKRTERKRMKQFYKLAQDELELKYIQSIDSALKESAYKHRNNTKKIILALKIGGCLIGAIISPQLALSMIKNLLGF